MNRLWYSYTNETALLNEKLQFDKGDKYSLVGAFSLFDVPTYI